MKLFQINKISSDTCGNSDIDKTYFVQAESILDVVKSIPGSITSYGKNGELIEKHIMGCGGYGTWQDNKEFQPKDSVVKKSKYIKMHYKGFSSFEIYELNLSSFAEIK